MRALLALTLLPLLLATACTAWFFSGLRGPDRSRPIARIETTGGTEYGATTDQGILFLGRTAREGPCRVTVFLGPIPIVEQGTIHPLGPGLFLADIDLQHQSIPVLAREVGAQDSLVALLWDGADVREVGLFRARAAGIEGDILAWPGEDLPAGTPIVTEIGDGWHFVGLVSARLDLEVPGGRTERYLVYAGLDRVRESWLVPEAYPYRTRVVHRPDGITVIKKVR